MKLTTLFSICCLALAAALTRPAEAKAREMTPPWLILKVHGKSVTGTAELQVDSAAAQTASKTPAPGAPARPAAAPDLQFRTAEGAPVTLAGSGNLGLPSDLLPPPPAAPLPGKGAPKLSPNALILSYELQPAPDGSRTDFIVKPKTGSSLYFAYVNRGGSKPMSRDVLPGLSLRQIEDGKTVPDVESEADRRFWLPAEISTSDGKWKVQGGDKVVVSHQGKHYQVQLYRSLRRERGTNPRLAFEGEKYLLSALIYLVADTTPVTK